jgi:hypothetical protein
LFVCAEIGLLLAGIASYLESVWGEGGAVKVTRGEEEGEEIMRFCPVFGALACLAAVMGVWLLIQIHVASHAPGILSHDTRFMHIYDEKEIVLGERQMLDIDALNAAEQSGPPSSGRGLSLVSGGAFAAVFSGGSRRTSVQSTTV